MPDVLRFLLFSVLIPMLLAFGISYLFWKRENKRVQEKESWVLKWKQELEAREKEVDERVERRKANPYWDEQRQVYSNAAFKRKHPPKGSKEGI